MYILIVFEPLKDMNNERNYLSKNQRSYYVQFMLCPPVYLELMGDLTLHHFITIHLLYILLAILCHLQFSRIHILTHGLPWLKAHHKIELNRIQLAFVRQTWPYFTLMSRDVVDRRDIDMRDRQPLIFFQLK